MSEPKPIATYRVPQPGLAWTEEERNRMSLVMRRDGAELPLQRERLVRKRVEVFGANPRIVQRARIAYLAHEAVERRGLVERARPSPIAGKRYVLDVSDGALVIAGDNGAAVSADEAAAIRAEEKRFGRAETLGAAVAQLRLPVGGSAAVPPAIAAQLFPGDLECTMLEVTLVERSANAATVALRVGLAGTNNGVDTRVDAIGTLRLDAATAQPLEMKLLGPVHLGGAVVADGTFELSAMRELDGDMVRWIDQSAVMGSV
jgi:hypothetical protein